VALTRIDGHALWLNAAAMREAGIDRSTADPPGGRILRDEKGEPTGVFVDNAMDLVHVKMHLEPVEARERRILRAANTALSLGLSGVHEMGIDDATIATYRKLAAEGRLPLRVYAGWGRFDLSKVPANTPPAFLTSAGVDDASHAKQTVDFYNALFDAKIPVELHIYGRGGYANGIKPRDGIPFGTWHLRFVEWAADLGLLKPLEGR
jgi:hypothetical protein